MHPVVHFEMPAKDIKRMAGFYSNVFGWDTQEMGEEMGNYVVASTAETDETGRPKIPGTINGGFYPRRPDVPDDCPSVVIGVENIHESMQNIADAGGELLGEPMTIPGVGLYVSFVDTEGNRGSILQPLMG